MQATSQRAPVQGLSLGAIATLSSLFCHSHLPLAHVGCLLLMHMHVLMVYDCQSLAQVSDHLWPEVAVQMDPKDAAILALRQEVELLRSENVYLRDQVGTRYAAQP